MAPPNMYWRFLIVTLLLGIPSSQILSSASNNSPSDTTNERLSRKEVINDIVGLLSKDGNKNVVKNEQAIIDGLGGQHSNAAAVGVSKKEDPTSGQDSPNNGLNLQAVAPAGADPQSGSPPEGQGQQQGGEADPSKASESEQEKASHAPAGTYQAHRQPNKDNDEEDRHLLSTDDTKFTVFVAIAVSAGFVGLMMAGICYYKFRKNAKAASDVEYPAYGVTGPMKEKIPSPGDRKLAQSAQMYHYQHQKQQMIAMEKANGDMKHDASDDDSEEDNVEGDYTVYECPGLAPTGEMEVINPLFRGGDENASANKETPSAPPDSGHADQ